MNDRAGREARPVFNSMMPSARSRVMGPGGAKPRTVRESAAPGTGVGEARHGLLVPIGDQAALAAAIRQIADPVCARHYGAVAERRMEAFRADAIAAKYEAAIRSVGSWIGRAAPA